MNSEGKTLRLPLNIYLLKTDIVDLHAALELSTFEEKINVPIDKGVSADLYLTHSEGVPLWLRTLVPQVDGIPSQLRPNGPAGREDRLRGTIDQPTVCARRGAASAAK